jgi:hypothetical protein
MQCSVCQWIPSRASVHLVGYLLALVLIHRMLLQCESAFCTLLSCLVCFGIVPPATSLFGAFVLACLRTVCENDGVSDVRTHAAIMKWSRVHFHVAYITTGFHCTVRFWLAPPTFSTCLTAVRHTILVRGQQAQWSIVKLHE